MFNAAWQFLWSGVIKAEQLNIRVNKYISSSDGGLAQSSSQLHHRQAQAVELPQRLLGRCVVDGVPAPRRRGRCIF